MKKSIWYLILMVLDILLIIGWPVFLFTCTGIPVWVAFLVGAVWYSDINDLCRHIIKYIDVRREEKMEDI